MHQSRRRDRRPVRRKGEAADRPPAAPFAVAGAAVVVVGFFSAREKDFAARMEAAAADVTALGARVVRQVVQRRGVSGGGVRNMSRPYSSRTLLSHGKVREVAAIREESGADVVVFLNPLSERQRRVLTEVLGCPVVSLTEARPGHVGPRRVGPRRVGQAGS